MKDAGITCRHISCPKQSHRRVTAQLITEAVDIVTVEAMCLCIYMCMRQRELTLLLICSADLKKAGEREKACERTFQPGKPAYRGRSCEQRCCRFLFDSSSIKGNRSVLWKKVIGRLQKYTRLHHIFLLWRTSCKILNAWLNAQVKGPTVVSKSPCHPSDITDTKTSEGSWHKGISHRSCEEIKGVFQRGV